MGANAAVRAGPVEVQSRRGERAEPFTTWAGLDDRWMARGACVGRPESWWSAAASRTRHVERARAVCSGCPVQDECLAFALRSRIRGGVWGGLTEPERRGTRR